MKVAILDDYHHAYDGSPHIARLREHAEVVVYTEPFPDAAATAAALRGCPVVIANRERTRFTSDLIARLPDLRLLVQTGNHYYHVNLDALTRAGIAMTKIPAGSGAIVAELTIGLMIASMRGIVAGHEAMRRGEWPLIRGAVLEGKTLGILGMGRIGSLVARAAQGFGMHVIAWGPTYERRAAATGVPARALEELLREADIVSIHLALSDLSRGLLTGERLRLMKPTAVLINTARGAIVDEAALVEVLRERRLAAAALDVFTQEPLPAESPLRRLDNVVLTPHIGWPTDATYEIFARGATERILHWLAGEPIPLVGGKQPAAPRSGDPG